MTDSTPLHTNPPLWLDEEELNDLPDAFTDKQGRWLPQCQPIPEAP
jgi:hypothetical protein